MAVTVVEAFLSLLTFALFWNGHFWLGLLVAGPVMVLSAARLVADASPKRLGRWAGLIFPPLWWWAWAHGLGDWGRSLQPVYGVMVLWVAVGGTVGIAVIEGMSRLRFHGMDIHRWRPFDSRFRLISASRNINLLILAAGLLLGRPDSGLVAVAWWTLLSLIFHGVRLAQMTEQQARRVKIGSWLDR